MSTDDRLSPQTRKVVLALVFGAVLPLLDTSIVNIAVHSLSGVFGAPVVRTQWVITGYGLASALAIPLSGWATRRFGAARVWITALAAFTITSILCASAWSIESLIAFRLVQGLAAGFSIPLMQTLMVTSADKAQATRAMTAVGLPAIIAPAIAPLLGGVLLDVFGWRSIFLINVPIGIAAVLLALRHLRRGPADHATRFDSIGYLLLAPGLLAAVYGLTTVGPQASRIGSVLLFAGALLIAGYVLHTRRVPSPLVDITLFIRRSFTSAWLTLVIASIVFYGGLFLIPLHYQQNFAYTAFAAGLLLALQSVGAYFSRMMINRLTGRWGACATAYLFIACAVVGTLPFAVPVGQTAGWPIVQGVGLLVRGGGIGALTVLTMSATYHQLTPGEVVHASTVSRLATQLGSALGVVVCTILIAITGGVQSTTFLYLTAFTALMAITAVWLPRGPIVRK
ncbi:DHA2 family efflux MFS transporter permease subunit [Brevibacterium sp. 50QC2O2]|jgi:EmrB/QacA subfamily drug resistance transporter|uniref:DHA2 family efflux MFS transporter permease subunit n=1 Tax=Brevibacterium sp. 50QC2O2 TaxID=2968459 RepID=UPI00211CB964|nr:DHA2 family efflux MFS transporter permease subunit [Brevibacterium sp. 50QC2O2]MCQ9388527.1 DHA2 family efflux MFS transporter permease subunit [Brevibacterium sp. 50QC2O2]